MPKPALVYTRLLLPTILPEAKIAAFLARLASDRSRGTMVLEVRADSDGIQHLVGCEATSLHLLRRLIADLLPGTLTLDKKTPTRASLHTARRITFSPSALPLQTGAAATADTLRAVYSALARSVKDGETVCLQLVLGPSRGPASTPAQLPDPAGMSLWQALTRGPQQASHETRNRVRDREQQFRFRCQLRVGIAAGTPDKRRRLGTELISALATLRSPGVQLIDKPDDPNRLNTNPGAGAWGLELSVTELVPLTGWPASDEPLPGMPPAHPKPMLAAAAVHSGQRVFLRSDFPGDDRALGLTRKDGSMHLFALGATGVGKTTLLQNLIELDYHANGGIAVVDPKGDMADYLLARIPLERHKDVVVLDATDPETTGWNPLDATGRDPDVVADNILGVFAKQFANGWGPRTSDIFSASLRTLARAGSPENPTTLMDLPRLWSDAAYRRQQVARVADDPILAGFWRDFENLKPAQQAAVLSSPLNKIRRLLLSTGVVRLIAQPRPAFKLRDIFRDNKIVVLSVNTSLVGSVTADVIGSLAISELWDAAQERVTDPDREKHPGLVVVDECDRFMNLPGASLTDALARSRSLAVSWALGAQYMRQLTPELSAAIQTNARTQVIYRQETADEAKAVLKLAPGLEVEDLMSLGKYQVYARLVADGVTTPWALASTLPPTPAKFDPAEVRQISKEHHPYSPMQAPATASSQTATDPDSTQEPDADVSTAPASLAPEQPIGRRHRSDPS